MVDASSVPVFSAPSLVPASLSSPALSSEESLRVQHLTAAKVARADRLAKLYGIADKTRRRQALEADASLCAADPVYWIKHWGWVRWEKPPDPDLRDCPFDLWDSQIELAHWFLEMLAAGKTALCVKSREKGVTWLVLHLLYHRWRFYGSSATLASRVEDLVDKRGDRDSLFEKIRYIHARQPRHLKEPRVLDQNMTFANLRNGGELKGTSTNENPKRGGRSEVYFIDEFMAIPPRLADAALSAAESVGKSLWIVGNPDDPHHPGERLRAELTKDQVRVVTWRSDPYLTEEWRQSRELPNGPLTPEQAKQEYDGVAGAVSGHKIFTGIRDDVVGYREDSLEWVKVKDAARRSWQVIGGWDFGSGASLLANVNALIDWTEDPKQFHIYIDASRVWQHTQWSTAAGDVHTMLNQYGGPKIQFGDPAGLAAESDQSSWIENLRSAGVPLWPLPYTINTTVNRDWCIRYTQALINAGRFHVNLDTTVNEMNDGEIILSALKAWERDVPPWVRNLDAVSRAHVPPKKDGNSHPCEAVLYLVAATLILCKLLLASGGQGTVGESVLDLWRKAAAGGNSGSGGGGVGTTSGAKSGIAGRGSSRALTALFREIDGQ